MTKQTDKSVKQSISLKCSQLEYAKAQRQTVSSYIQSLIEADMRSDYSPTNEDCYLRIMLDFCPTEANFADKVLNDHNVDQRRFLGHILRSGIDALAATHPGSNYLDIHTEPPHIYPYHQDLKVAEDPPSPKANGGKGKAK